jgi:hypothetical protein
MMYLMLVFSLGQAQNLLKETKPTHSNYLDILRQTRTNS